MADMTVGPCSLYVEPDAIQACSDDVTISDERALVGAQVATRVMYLATGRVYDGECELDQVRPCGCRSCCGPSQDMGWGVILWPGTSCAGSCTGGRCGCGGLQELDLQLSPLQTVTEVLVDGQPLVPETDYRVDDWRWLVRLDGHAWPNCQDLSLPPTEEGTFAVSGTWGLPPSPAVVEGTRALGLEIAKACTPGAKCQLPQRITSKTAQGVSMAFIDPQEFLIHQPGQPVRTGVYLADLAISQENPDGLVTNGVMINPETYAPGVRRTHTNLPAS